MIDKLYVIIRNGLASNMDVRTAYSNILSDIEELFKLRDSEDEND